MDWHLRILDYHAWRIENFSRHLLTLPEAEFVKATTGSFATLGSLVGHVAASERIFYNLLIQPSGAAPLPKFESESPHAILRNWFDMAAHYRRLAGTLDGSSLVHALVLPGRPGTPDREMTMAEALLQLVDHQAYHLGQVTYTLRHLGQPVSKGTTFFAYLFQ
jgi:uncharacterized damage-inducible protein DinB